ncbi:MAG: methyltransferase domain-containing protein [Bacteroidetes bacterium]|nr:methyltransferase domain-containing protein [Bacteroidota bacterium]
MIRSLKQRVDEPELLDDPGIPEGELIDNLKELEWINRLLGGHAITISGLKGLIGGDRSRTWTITDLGCGGGDTLRAISHWAGKHQIPVRLVGIDLNPACIRYAQRASQSYNIEWICADFREAIPADTDILINSLFCHHLDDSSLKELLLLMKNKARRGFVINDLQRHQVAFASIWILTRLLNGSRLVRHDAPLSVARSFHRHEWLTRLSEAGLASSRLSWRWAFRWQVVYEK